MGETTGIEWTDATWTPVRARYHMTYAADFSDGSPSISGEIDRVGWHCEHVSEGCRNCYAETMNKRLGTGLDYKPGNLSPRGPVEMFLDEKLLLAPLKWRKPKRIFVCSMTDLFADFVPDAFIDRMFAVMALCPQHSFQVLTKRPERMLAYLAASPNGTSKFMTRHNDALYSIVHTALHPTVDRAMQQAVDRDWRQPLPNVWLGVSVEDQEAADARIPLLLNTPAAVRFLSCEPLLGPVVVFAPWILEVAQAVGGKLILPGIDWMIAGGESGPGARPMHPDWARGLRDQCVAAGVPFLFKQWGEWTPAFPRPSETPGRYAMMARDPGAWTHTSAVQIDFYPRQFNSFGSVVLERVGKKRAGRLLDGVQHDGMPG